MRFLKKTAKALVALALVAALGACSDDDDETSDGSGNSGTEQGAEETDGTFSISFDAAGLAVNSAEDQMIYPHGSFITVKKTAGETFTESDVPSITARNGYSFAGWYFDTDYTQPFSSFTVTEAKTIYAKYTDSTTGETVKMYKITRSNPNYDYGNRVQLTSGVLTFWMAAATGGNGQTRCVEGQVFDGWFYDSNYSKPVYNGDTISEDVTLYAKWVALSDLKAGTSATFAGCSYNEVSSAKWFTRSSTKDERVGSYIYTKTTAFESGIDSHLGSGIQKIDGAVVWSESFDNRAYISTGDIIRSSRGINLRNSFEDSDELLTSAKSVTIANLRSFVMITATGAGTVTAELQTGSSSNSPRVAALVDSDGTVLNTIALPDSNGSYTLSADVSKAGNVYFVYSRNGDSHGLGVKSIKFTAKSSDSNNTNTTGFNWLTASDLAGKKYSGTINSTSQRFEFSDDGSLVSFYVSNSKIGDFPSSDSNGGYTYSQGDKSITFHFIENSAKLFVFWDIYSSSDAVVSSSAITGEFSDGSDTITFETDACTMAIGNNTLYNNTAGTTYTGTYSHTAIADYDAVEIVWKNTSNTDTITEDYIFSSDKSQMALLYGELPEN